MRAIEIKKDIYWVGVKDWNLREFHGYTTPKGSTYNAYLIMDKKITLVDGVKKHLSLENLARIKSLVDFSKLDYFVVNHVEQDHSGNIPEIMKFAPQVKIVTTLAGKNALEAHFDTTGWQYEIIKTGETLSIGNRTLEFLATPMLHWPESMMTYVREDKLLMPNDGFGQHYASDAFFAKDAPFDTVMEYAKSYYANILYPYAAQADKALKDAGEFDFEIEMIAPSHGLIWSGKKEVDAILSNYAKWASGGNEGKAVIVYDTMWGATEILATAAMGEFQAAGIPVSKHFLAVEDVSEILPDFLDAKYILIGTPTVNNQLHHRVAGFMAYMRGLAPRNKLGLAFGSYGWKSGVIKQIQDVFDVLGWNSAQPFEEKFTPKSDVLEKFKQHVREFIKMGGN